MGYLSKEIYEARLKEIKQLNKSKERKQKLKEEKRKYRTKFKIETHKFLAFFLFVVFNVILVYSMVVMWVFQDLTYLGVLITDIVGQILLYAIYCLKAYNGKKQEEQMRFEKEKLLGVFSADDIYTDLEDTETAG